MEEKFKKAFAECIRLAMHNDESYVSDLITFQLDEDYEGFCRAFEEFFGEPLYEGGY